MSRYLILTIFLLLLSPVVALDNFVSITQTNLDAVFAVSQEDNTTTAYYSIGYLYDSNIESVQWLFPLPPGSYDIKLAPAELPGQLNTETRPNLDPSSYPCDLSPTDATGDGPGEPGSQNVEPESGTIEHFSDIDSALRWLDKGNGELTETQTNRLQQYVDEGYSFAGMTIAHDTREPEARFYEVTAFIQRSPLLQVTYPGTEPILPVAFHSDTMNTYEVGYENYSTMPVRIYIYSDVPYAAQNIPSIELDFSDD